MAHTYAITSTEVLFFIRQVWRANRLDKSASQVYMHPMNSIVFGEKYASDSNTQCCLPSNPAIPGDPLERSNVRTPDRPIASRRMTNATSGLEATFLLAPCT